jgi:anaerobic selenocysteine-containing dehydrogenase
MPGGRAPSASSSRRTGVLPSRFYLVTRRGKQFNSMTFGAKDRLMGSKSRDAIFIAPEDAERLGLQNGARVTVRSELGAMNGTIQLAPVKASTLQAYWPEANVLIPRRADPVSGAGLH